MNEKRISRFARAPHSVEQIEREYNADYDMPHAPCPQVSWVEYGLLQMILELEERIAGLEGKLASMDEALENVYFRN